MSEKVSLEQPIKTLKALADALGLDPAHRIRTIDIHADTQSIATVTVHMLIDADRRGKVCEVVKRYQLTEKPPESGDCTVNLGQQVKFREFT